MKKPVLVLLTLVALLPFAQAAMAQTPAPTPAPVVDAATAQFLATLADGQTQAPSDLTPAPLFMTNCGNGPACGTGQLCCFTCGAPPPDDDTSICYNCITGTRCPRPV